GIGIGVGELLQAIESVFALLAAESIDGPGVSTESREGVPGARVGAWAGKSSPPRFSGRNHGRARRSSRCAGCRLDLGVGGAWTYSAASLPQGGGGASTGVVRSNSTLNSRPPGRVSS